MRLHDRNVIVDRQCYFIGTHTTVTLRPW
jgi:hypothetical protein